MNSLTVLQSHAVATSSNYYRLGHWRTFSGWYWHILEGKFSQNVLRGCILLKPSGKTTGYRRVPSLSISDLRRNAVIEL